MLKLLQRLYQNRSSFLIAAILAVGLFAAWLSQLRSLQLSTWQENLLLGLAASFISSGIFSAVHVYFTSLEFSDFLREISEGQSQRAMESVIKYMAEAQLEFMPIALYKPTNLLGSKFNEDIARSLSNASSYRFRGLTGHYVSIRLQSSGQMLESLKLAIADPRDEQSHRFRLSIEMARRNGKVDYESALNEVRRRTLQSLIGLFEIRAQCQELRVLLTTDSYPDRQEIFDDSIYITPFEKKGVPVHQFPSSFRFGPQSFYYSSARRAFDQAFHLANESDLLVIRPETPLPDFIEQLKIMGIDCSADLVAKARVSFFNEVDAFKRESVANASAAK